MADPPPTLRAKCERVGCGRFTRDLKPVRIKGNSRLLCKRCRVLFLERIQQQLAREEKPLKRLFLYAQDMWYSNRFREHGEAGDIVDGIIIWRPWRGVTDKNKGKSHVDVDD